jgi:uncharacterized repeat protein (TIGR01451 family)
MLPIRLRRLLTASALAPGLWLAVSAIAAPVVTAGEPPVEISVRSRGDAEVVREGDEIGYEISVRNRSENDYPDAVVTQMLPRGFRYVDGEPAAAVKPNGLQWDQALGAGDDVELMVDATAGSPRQMEQAQLVRMLQPDAPRASASGERGFTTTVCVRERATGPILACSSEFATLMTPVANDTFWLRTAALLLVVVTAAGIVWFGWRQGRSPAAPSPA